MKYEDEYEEIYNYNEESLDNLGETYEEVYDQNGYSVHCPNCSARIRWNNAYTCPECLWSMDLETFANYIGFNVKEYKYIYEEDL